MLNATFSNISAISWRPVLVVEEAENVIQSLKKTNKKPPLYRYQVNQENEKKKPLFGSHHNGMVLK